MHDLRKRLNKLPSLLLKMCMKLHFSMWTRNIKHEEAQQRIARWIVISRRVFRLVDSRKAFMRWRARVRLDKHAELTLTRLFVRIPKVVYRSTLRRWSTRISRMKQYRANRLAIREPFDTWCKYARYWVACKSRLDYVSYGQQERLPLHLLPLGADESAVYSKLVALRRCVHLNEGW